MTTVSLPQYVVRCGTMRTLGVFAQTSADGDGLRHGDWVIVSTPRGTEIGTVLCEATPAAVNAMESEPIAGSILRAATEADRRHWDGVVRSADDDMQGCRRLIQASRLSMQLVEVERIFGGEKLVVYYTADHRVDFRSLVRELAKQFRTRIEMKQIGVRDEAKLLADYGDCGQPICCSRFLSKMPPVSMRMAKLQRATLDPTKISGRCGRLKCCLRYESDTYERAAADLPPVGSLVATPRGNMRIEAIDALAEQMVARTDDGRRVTLQPDEVLTTLRKPRGR